MPKLLARAKDSFRAGPVIAFSGYEYVRYEWRPVPAGHEEEAKRHALLDLRLLDDEPEVVPEPEGEPQAEVVPEAVAEPMEPEPDEPELPRPSEAPSKGRRRSRKGKPA